MIDENSKRQIDPGEDVSPSREKLDGKKVTLVYTMYHHLGDFVVIGGLLKKFDLLKVDFRSLVAHRDSPHVASFNGNSKEHFFNVATLDGFFALVAKLRREKEEGRLIFGIPMAPGSLQAFFFFWVLKKLGALTYIVDFNLMNADVLTPPRRRYIFDRHLAQAAELFKRPEWMKDCEMPLATSCPAKKRTGSGRRIGFFPWSGRRWLAEFQWPESCWLELGKSILKESDGEIVLLGKDDDFTKFERGLRSGLPEEVQKRLTSRPADSLQGLVVSLQEIDCLITLNTSALHLAHALKLPVVALCGSSADFWIPEGDHVRVVRDSRGVLPPSDQYRHDALQPSVQRIEVSEVYSAFEDLSQRTRAKP